MANPIIEQIPIRLQLTAISNPPAAPLDRNTGLPPAAWRANACAIALGVFDVSGLAVDLSNLLYLQIILQDSEDAAFVLATKQIDAVDITDVITVGGWLDGTEANGIGVFTAAEMDQSLAGAASRDLWMIVRGVTAGGGTIVYGAGVFTLFNASNALPPVVPAYTSYHEQTTNGPLDATVTPTTQMHTEVVTVGGTARTESLLLGIAGMKDGALLFLTLNLPATLAIEIQIRSELVGNPVLVDVWTGNVLQALIVFHYKSATAAWVPKFQMFPPLNG